MLSDTDIARARDGDILIAPYEEGLLTPVGYDVSVGNLVYWVEGEEFLEPTDGTFSLPANGTFHILTREVICLSERIGGTLHSRVSHTLWGLSHISTTLDPGWDGPLVVAVHNHRDIDISLSHGDAFATAVFFRVVHASTVPLNRNVLGHMLHPHGPPDNSLYFRRFSEEIENMKGEISFMKRRSRAANVKRWRQIERRLPDISVMVLIVLAGSLGLYWQSVSPMFPGARYDSQVVSGQLAAISALIAALIALRMR